ncbi:MAG: hypothetical protein Unbinned579contig1003_25 [Prokaryotic dsDNA virus sp.]|nr:MAG: hypothetical protein Unbinned579contig1003_25 [Prokaryotic dsDNA virus sp.]|tara:strand:+ start:22940 stop:23476 length:537 start_codon:yes stop_codon:yes gene_type:complete
MSITNKTYNNIINTLKNIGNNHNQITTTTTGDIWEIDLNKETLMPLMHITPVNVTAGESELNYNFQIFIMDLVSEKENWTEANYQSADYLSNEQQVLSDNLQICVDIIGMLRHGVQQSLIQTNDINSPVYFTDGEPTIEPFQERFDNLLAGWTFSFTVTVMNDFTACNTPMQDAGQGE